MDSCQDTPILEFSKTAKRCVLAYEALYEETKLNIASHNFSPSSFLSDRQDVQGCDEVMYLPEVYLDSSGEFTSGGYCLSDENGPLPFVIKRYDSPITKISDSVENVVNRVSDKDSTVSCETNSTSVPTDSDITMKQLGLHEGIFNSSRESNQSIITQEYIENIINGSDIYGENVSLPVHILENDSYNSESDVPMPVKSVQPRFDGKTNENLLACNEILSGMIAPGSCNSGNECKGIVETLRHDVNRPTSHISSPELSKGKEIFSFLSTVVQSRGSLHDNMTEDESKVIVSVHDAEVKGDEENIVDECATVVIANVILDDYSLNVIEYSGYSEKLNGCGLKGFMDYGAENQLEVVAQSEIASNTENNVIETTSEELSLINDRIMLPLDQVDRNVECALNNDQVNPIYETTISVESAIYEDNLIEHSLQNSDFQTEVCSPAVTGDTVNQNDFKKSENEIDINTELFQLHKNSETEVPVAMLQEPIDMKVMTQDIVPPLTQITLHKLQGLSDLKADENIKEALPVVTSCVTHSSSKLDQCGNVQSFPNHRAISSQVELGKMKITHDSPKQESEQLSRDEELATYFNTVTNTNNSVQSINVKEINISSESRTNSYSILNKIVVNNETLSVPTQFTELEDGSILIDKRTETFSDASCSADHFLKAAEIHSLIQSAALVESFTEDTMDCAYNDASSDGICFQHSPLLFSSDDENSYCTAMTTDKKSTPAAQANMCDEITINEKKKLQRLQEALTGIPPPPSVTIPQLDAADILKLLKENEKLMLLTDARNKIGMEVCNYDKSPLKLPSVEGVKDYSWPESKNCCYYGIQYNHGKASEEYELLCQKLRERYVGCETTSTCSVWLSHDISSKMRKMVIKRSAGHSPGKRLSHLACRRQAFSSANMLNSNTGQLLNSSQSAERRLIMVERKKSECRRRSKTSQSQRCELSVDCSRLQQTKRALFKSPPTNLKKMSSASKSRSGSKKYRNDIDRRKLQNSKRALWPNTSKDNITVKEGCDRALTNLSGQVNMYGKRRREGNGDSEQPNKCRRKMFFGGVVMKERNDCSKKAPLTASCKNYGIKTAENRLAPSHSVPVAKDLYTCLNERHRKKLLWAVAEVLRAEGISLNHPLFRPCATSLVRVICSNMPDLNSKRESSTSDLMLKLAKENVNKVMSKKK